MHNFPEQRKGPAVNLASAFCSAAEFLGEAKIGGIKAGTVLLFAALIVALVAYYLFDTLLFVYLLILGAIPGQIAQFLICKREGLGDYLLERGLRYAGLGVAGASKYNPIEYRLFSQITRQLGGGSLFRRRFLLGRFSYNDWAFRR